MSRPAPAVSSIAALTALELRLTARRGENVLVTLIIPVAVLLFFAGTSIVPGIGRDPAGFLLPGAVALAIIAAGLVNLGIATAYERAYGVLKRLGGAPIPRWAMIGAKLAAILVLEVVQVAVLVAAAVLFLHWAPGPAWSAALVILAVVLGTLAFAGLGLLLAGTLRAEATLAIANGLFLGFLMLGGIVLPIDHLPTFLQPIAAVLPATALADLLRIGFDSGVASGAARTALEPALLLGAWGVAAAGLASVRFRWD